VSALAALLISQNSNLARNEIQKIIEQSAIDLYESGWDTYSGWGRIDAWNALRISLSGEIPGNEVWRGSISLSGNVTVPTGKKLTILSGTTLALNGHSITTSSGSITIESGASLGSYALLQQGSSIRGIYPSIQAALSSASSGQSVNVPSGTYTFSDTLTVSSGVTLQTGTETTFNFAGAYKLHIDGKLVANGTTFTRSGGQWYGIEFHYGNSGSSLSYCTIENAQFGLHLTGTSPSVSNCIIQNNSTGVYAAGTYATFLWTILDNNTRGFDLTSNGDPTISHNVLRYNNYAIYGDANSVPVMGGTSGSNSFNYTNYYDIYTTYSGTINAQSNWWYPWSPSFYGNVDYSNYLGSDPNTWAGRLAGPPNRPVLPPTLAKMSGASTDSAGMKELDQAYQLLVNGNQDQALGAFQSVASRYPDVFAGGRALAFADHILEKSGRDAKLNLTSIIVQRPNSKVGVVAKSLLTGHLVKEGNYKEALENSISLMENSDGMIAKKALFDAGNIQWYRLADRAKGTEFFRKLIANYPQDPLSVSAQATLGEWVGGALPNQQKSAQAQKNIEAGPILQNYPNPFNPSTIIRYTVPMNGLVSVKVFDVLGREAAVLVNEFKVAGIHQALFNASSLPSGVYVYRLETPGKTLVQKMTLLR
jgi:TolA-binding protein